MSSSFGDRDIGKEYDNEIRETEVIFFKSPVEGVDSDRIERSHHGLCFNFDGGRTITVGGTRDEDSGRLVPIYSHEAPGEQASGYPLLTMKLSPKRVWECTKNNPTNNTVYCLASNNCQNWLRAFAKLVLGELYRLLCEKYPTLLEAEPNQFFFALLEKKVKSKKAGSSSFGSRPSSNDSSCSVS